MNKRETKRLVCHEASLVLENAIDSGWEYWQGMTDEDAARWETALSELVEELRRRGWKA